MLKHIAAICALSFAAASASAGDWTYTTKTDGFDGNKTRAATLRADRQGWLSVEENTQRANVVAFAGPTFVCFPSCDVLLKFDEETPSRFTAYGPGITSNSITILDFDRFIDRIKVAKTLVLRAPQLRAPGDLTFSVATAYDPERFAAAERHGALKKQCADNAVREDYSACMTRLAGQP